MMVGQRRNKRPFWYQLVTGEEPVYDENGYRTGETVPQYSNPVKLWGNISPASGWIRSEVFGIVDRYERIINPMPLDCPLDEKAILFIDKKPEYDESGNVTNTGDYIVTQVAKSLNHKAYRIKKVGVDDESSD